MSKYNKAVNTFRLAMGTACYCKTCQALLAFGVNSRAAGKALVRNPGAYEEFLRAHEAYHKAKLEDLPVEWKADALTPDFKANVLYAKPKPIFVRPVLGDEERALAKLRACIDVKQVNARMVPAPIRKLDTAAFKGW